MAERSIPSAPRPAHAWVRLRWPWLAGLVAVVLVMAVWLALPWLTCRWLQSRTPLIAGTVIIRGACLGGTPPPTMVIGVCDRATFLAIWRGGSGRWQPGSLLADGQHAWGTFTDAPEISWRLDLDDRAREPRITATIPAGVAERLLARELRTAHAQVSGVRLATASLHGEPGDPGTTTWDLELGGTANLDLNQQLLPVKLGHLRAGMATHLGDALTDGRPLTATITLSDLVGEGPFIGSFAPWKGWLETRITEQTAKDLRAVRIPVWWPERLQWDLQIIHPAQQEL